MNCLTKILDTASVNLSRANEIVETIISRVEGSGIGGKDVPSAPAPNCLMNVAADCNDSAQLLANRLDYLATLLTGPR